MSLNLISPATFTTGVLIGDTVDTANSGTDSIPHLTTVNGVPVSASLEIQSQIGALLISRLTTAERDAMTVVNGMIIYNITTNMFNLRENGNWIELGAGNGDVTGPNGAIPNNIATFNGPTGKIIQDSGVNIAQVPPPAGAGFTSADVTEISEIDIISYKTDVGLILAHNTGLDTDSIIMGFFTDFSNPFEHSVLITDGLQKAPTTFSALLELSSDVGALLISRMHTDSRNMLDAENGMIVYNLDTNTFDVFQNGLWQTLGTGGSVTSVAAVVPGGSHGLTITGSPITGSGTFTFTLGTELQGLSQLSSAGPNLGLGGVYRTGTGTYVNRALVGTSNQINVSHIDGVLGNPTFSIADNPVIPGSAAMTLPTGGLLSRPLFPHNGMIRYNTLSNQVEAYVNGAWRDLFSGTVPPGTVVAVGATSLTPGIFLTATPTNPIVAAGVIEVALNAELIGLAEPLSVGLMVRAAPGVYEQVTIAGFPTEITVINGNGILGPPVISIANDAVLPGFGGIKIPAGLTPQRPLVPLPGTIRLNLDPPIFKFEGWNGIQWVQFAGEGAPSDAQYVIGAPNIGLPNAQVLSLMIAPTPGLGLMVKKVAVGSSGVLVGAVPEVDYVTGPTFDALAAVVGGHTLQLAAIDVTLYTPFVGLVDVSIAHTAAIALIEGQVLSLQSTVSDLRNVKYIIQMPNATVPDAQALSTLPSGFMMNTAGTGVISIAVPGGDFYGPGKPTFLKDNTLTNGKNDLFVGCDTANNFPTMAGINNTGMGTFTCFSITTGSNNSAYGYRSLLSIVDGSDNSAFGMNSLSMNVSGTRNTASGESSLQQNVASDNCAFGYQSAIMNTSGTRNCTFGVDTYILGTISNDVAAFGYRALKQNTSNENSAFGSLALENNTTGSGNTALGYACLRNHSVGDRNTGTGHSCLMASTASDNSAYGYQAMILTNSGGKNSAFGSLALGINTSGVDNSAFGYNALHLNVASQSSAFGSGALLNNTTGSGNSAFGFNCLQAHSVSNRNSGFGNATLSQNLGDDNSAFGYQAMSVTNSASRNAAFGSLSLALNQTGSDNSSFGYNSLNKNTSGQNSAFGSQSLKNNTSGGGNSAFGFNCLAAHAINSRNSGFGSATLANNMADDNSGFGYQALALTNTGARNAAFGSQAMITNTTGSDCVAVGANALFFNNADNNTAIGSGALQNNVSGNGLTAVGWFALNSNTTANDCVAVGREALRMSNAVRNVAVGSAALSTNVSGVQNTAIGNAALQFSTSHQNTAIGAQSLQTLTTGQRNIGVGYNSLLLLTTGSNNTVAGSLAMQAATSSSDCTVFGSGALIQNLTNNNITSIGSASCSRVRSDNTVAVGAGTFNYAVSNVTATNSTALGTSAGSAQPSYDSCTFLGYNADASVSGLTNATAIGANAVVSASNCLVLGAFGTNVGINITDPEAPLHVNGSIKLKNPLPGWTATDVNKFKLNAQSNNNTQNGFLGAPQTVPGQPAALYVKADIVGITTNGTTAAYATTFVGVRRPNGGPTTFINGIAPVITFTNDVGFTGTATWTIVGATSVSLNLSSTGIVNWTVSLEYFSVTGTTA